MRTVKEFVMDLLRDGRSDEHILAVARCTQWEPQMSIIKNNLKKKGDKWRKKFSKKSSKKEKVNASRHFSSKNTKSKRIVLKRRK